MAGLVLCLGLGVGIYLGIDGSRDEPPATGAEGQATSRADAATALLEDLAAALTTGSAADARDLAAPGDTAAEHELGVLRGNLRRIGITDLSMTYVDETAGSVSTGAETADSSWVGDVQVSWRIRKYDVAESRMLVTMAFRESRDGAAFVSARDDFGEPAPLWLLDRVAVRRSHDSLVMVGDGGVSEYDDLVSQAVVEVRKVLPSWRGKLVAEVPASEPELNRILGAEDGAYGAIAAVTSPVDGTQTGGAPVHIFVNPPVFASLGDQGAQIVMSHEATHVATEAATSSMPAWLVEGFADYVALAHADLPVEVAASQVIERVRSHGAPPRLPDQVAFETPDTLLGASYEAAWLACRLLGETYGEAKLVEFYERSDRDAGTDAAFRGVLDTSEEKFTKRWRTYLSGLAD